MSTQTKKLKLLKKSVADDGADTFNVDTMLNDNWDKVDSFAKEAGDMLDGCYAETQSHIKDTTKHITASERTAWNAKQGKLTFDTAPTSGSTNPVTSGGIKTAIDNATKNKADLVGGKVPSSQLPEMDYAKTDLSNVTGDYADIFQAVKKVAQVGTIIQSVRTDLGDAWALCNGDAVDPEAYPTLYEKLAPITLLNARYKTIDSGYYCVSNVCYANGYYVYLKGVLNEGLYVMVSTDGLNYEKGITIKMGDYDSWPTNLIYYNGRFIAPYKYGTSPYYEKAYSFDDPLSGSATFQDISNNSYSYSTYGAFLLDNYAMVLGGDIYYTSNGTSWLSANVGLGSEWNGHEKDKILKGNGYYVIGDFYVYGSSSSVNVWTSNQLLSGYTKKTIESGTNETIAGTFFDGERFVLVAKSGTWFYATNPTGTWLKKTEPASDWAKYENGYYYTSTGYKKNWDDAWTPYDNATLTPSRFMGVVNNIAQGGNSTSSSHSNYVNLNLARIGKELPLLASDATGSQPTYHYIKVKEK